MKNKHRRKKPITWGQFNVKLNQYLLELGLKKEKQLEEQHYLQLYKNALFKKTSHKSKDYLIRCITSIH